MTEIPESVYCAAERAFWASAGPHWNDNIRVAVAAAVEEYDKALTTRCAYDAARIRELEQERDRANLALRVVTADRYTWKSSTQIEIDRANKLQAALAEARGRIGELEDAIRRMNFRRGPAADPVVARVSPREAALDAMSNDYSGDFKDDWAELVADAIHAYYEAAKGRG